MSMVPEQNLTLARHTSTLLFFDYRSKEPQPKWYQAFQSLDSVEIPCSPSYINFDFCLSVDDAAPSPTLPPLAPESPHTTLLSPSGSTG